MYVVSKKLLAGWEIASVISSCLIVEWLVFPLDEQWKWVAAIPAASALTLMTISHREHGEQLSDLGFRLDNFWAACKLLLLPTALATAIIVAAGLLWYGLHLQVWKPRLIALPLWALLQQYALQGFLNRRSQILLGRNWRSAFLVGLVFALLHLPNLSLAAMTLLAGSTWAAIYQRQPNLYALALSHALASAALVLVIPTSVVTGMRVGFKYFL